MVTAVTLMKEIETLSEESVAVAFDFVVFLKSREKPRKDKISIEDAYGIFKGIDTSFEREEEDRV